MAAATAGSVDIDKPGKYPIVLSDALLGKASKETYTGIRYNHKPDASKVPSSHLEPSITDAASYDLSFTDNSDTYAYHGARTSGDGQYVLIFDPVKKHFVLHRIDSTFDMNLVSAPWTQDEAKLRSQYSQIETPQTKNPAVQPPQRKPVKPKNAPAAQKPETKKKKPAPPKKAKPPPRAPTPEEEEDEESDDGLLIEYPDGPSPEKYTYQPTPIFHRDDSEEVSEEDSDAEGEYEEERNQDVDHLKLPSPANHGGLSDEDIELDLEAELEQALKETEERNANESSESEEE